MEKTLKEEVAMLVALIAQALVLVGDDHLEDHTYLNEYDAYQESYDSFDNKKWDDDNPLPLEERTLYQVAMDIEAFCEDHFIRSGNPSFPSQELKDICAEHGLKLRMYAGETDGFGWLSGCLDFHLNGKNLPTIVYG